VAAGGGDFDGALDVLLTFDLADKFLFGGSGFGPTIECGGTGSETLARRKLFASIRSVSVLNEAGVEVTFDSLQNSEASDGTPAHRLHCP
jgi:hypothetical protein